MDSPVLLRTAMDNGRRLQFMAAVLAAATTQRTGASRWTELTVYRLPRVDGENPPRGGYVISKIGRSLVAHRPDCVKANPRRMPSFASGKEEAAVTRVPCLTCQPEMGPIHPTTLLECTRYVVLQARTPADLAKVLLQGRPGEPAVTSLVGVVAETMRQVRLADSDFDHWCAEHYDLLEGSA